MLPQCFLTSGMTIAISAMKRRRLIDVSSRCDIAANRSTRASLMARLNYFEGVLNRWIGKLDSSFNVDDEPIGKRSNTFGVASKADVDCSHFGLARVTVASQQDLSSQTDRQRPRDCRGTIEWQIHFRRDSHRQLAECSSKRLEMDCHPNAPNVLHNGLATSEHRSKMVEGNR